MALKRDTHADLKAARLASLPAATAPALEALERELRGFLVVPGMPSYAEASAANPLYPATPAAVVFCATPGDVRATLRTVRERGYPMTARSGRHSTAGYSVCDGIVLDVSLMNHVTVDYGARTARVGAGANFGQINAVLDTYALHVPGGTCADVGIAGYSQGGGYGFTSRELGMNSDNVMSVTVMLPDGAIVTGSPAHNEALHWALRGGTGGNFGVLLELTLRLYDVYDVWGFCLQWDAQHAPAALAEMQSSYMREGAPDELGYQVALSTLDPTKPDRTLVMMGMFHGEREAGMEAIASLRAIGPPTMSLDSVDTYANLNNSLLDVLPGPGPVGTFEAKRSGYVATPLGEDGWGKVVEYFDTTPNPYNIIAIEPYGGAIARVPPLDTAFVHRAVDMDLFVDSFWQTGWKWNGEQEAWDWANGFRELVTPYLTGNVYQNYPERDLVDYRSAYWGDAFLTLLAIKQAADPNGVLAFAQDVSPYPDEPGITRSGEPVRFSTIDLEPEPYSRRRR